MGPKEDPKDKAERLRQRRIAEIDRMGTAQQNASGLTTDLRGVYGLRALSMFGMGGGPGKSAPALKPTTNTFGNGR